MCSIMQTQANIDTVLETVAVPEKGPIRIWGIPPTRDNCSLVAMCHVTPLSVPLSAVGLIVRDLMLAGF